MLSSWLQLPYCVDHSCQAVIGAVRHSLNSLCCQLRKTGRKAMGKTKCLQLRYLHLPQLGDVVKPGSGERLPESIHKHRQCEHPVGGTVCVLHWLFREDDHKIYIFFFSPFFVSLLQHGLRLSTDPGKCFCMHLQSYASSEAFFFFFTAVIGSSSFLF